MATKYFALPEDFNDPPYLVPDQEENAGTFKAWLEREETIILKKLLGLQLYNDLQEAWDDTPPVSGIWFDLAGGAEYEFGNILYEYKGLKSLLVPYLFSLWTKLEIKKFTHSGFATAVQDENQLVNGAELIAKAYNDYSEQVGGCREIENSLYGFLIANESDYGTGWLMDFEPPGNMNMFGI